MDYQKQLDYLKSKKEAPLWLEESGFRTLSKGYLLEGETPRMMYWRVANAAAKILKKPGMAKEFFKIIDNNWLCLATPVACNLGTSRGLPISCYGSYVDDSVDGIFKSFHETAMLSKNGGGIGKYWGAVRSRDEVVSGNGKSRGIVPWLKNEEGVLSSVSQGDTRNGAGAQYLPVSHGDIDEFLDIRRQTGDESRRCRSKNFHHAVIIDDDFMTKAKAGGKKERDLWAKILKTRTETGEPYLMFGDTVNRNRPEWYVKNNLYVNTSQLCNEIYLFNDPEHTFVCCLSSMNLARWDEWKDTSAVQLSIWFLDAVMEEFIQKAANEPGLERAVRFAQKGRALGLGALGWHTLLQKKLIPFEGFQAMTLNATVFRHLRSEADIATRELAKVYGEPLWTKGFGVRNTHLLAIAPTVSNSINSGGISQGIEPFAGNIYMQDTAKGTLVRKNPVVVELLQAKGKDTMDVWERINTDGGSVRNLSFLSDLEKEVFKTAREISQFAIVQQAAQRQRWIDQGQSVNLFFSKADNILSEDDRNKLGKYIHEVHLMAYEQGLYGLYYMRSEAAIKGDAVFRDVADCVACEG
jgi:ribonucleoside-diphosphate reductase alpha chain